MADTWLEGAGSEHPFGVDVLAYGAVAARGERPRLVARLGDQALDLAGACAVVLPELAPALSGGTLNPLLAAGAPAWRRLRAALQEALADRRARPALEPLLRPLAGLEAHLAIEVADYVDFYASEHHASNVGRILRPGSEPLPAAWRHLPIGYHGRAGTVVISGTPVRRPHGLSRRGEEVVFAPSARLDFEAEVAFVLGGPTALGEAVPLEEAEEHVFGLCLLNDWSARDIQAFEYVPLGPFLGKSFATSLSPWIVPLEALADARCPPPPRPLPLAPYLDDAGAPPGGLRIELCVELNGEVVSRPPFASMYWTPAQLVAHLTVNGARLRPGDLIASGTVSGPGRHERGSLIELAWGGEEPLALADGSSRSWLEDGDVVTVSAAVPAAGRAPRPLGEVSGRVLPAR